jgi:hypothetical protein
MGAKQNEGKYVSFTTVEIPRKNFWCNSNKNL